MQFTAASIRQDMAVYYEAHVAQIAALVHINAQDPAAWEWHDGYWQFHMRMEPEFIFAKQTFLEDLVRAIGGGDSLDVSVSLVGNGEKWSSCLVTVTCLVDTAVTP